MKKSLLLASAMLASVSAFAATDGSTYETKNGITCVSRWVQDLQNTGTFTSEYFPFVANADRVRTAAIHAETNKVYLGYSKPMLLDGDEAAINTAHIITFNLVSGAYEGETMLTLDGAPIRGLICANQIGVDDFGNVWFAGYVQTTSTTPVKIYKIDNLETGECSLRASLQLPADEAVVGEGRMDYCHVVGDITGEQAGAVVMWALADPGIANVHRWMRDQGNTENPVGEKDASGEYIGDWYGGFDGYVTLDPAVAETYPADKTWGTAPILTMVADEEYSGSQFYIDGFHTYPALYDTSGAMLDSFSFDSDNVFTPNPGCNGVCEFTLGGNPFMAYPISQPNDNGAIGAQFRVVQLGEGYSFSGMQQLWDLPEKSHGQLGDGIRMHNLVAKKFIDENGKEAVYLLTYKCKNGIGVYVIAEEGFVDANGEADPDAGVEGVVAESSAAITVAGNVINVSEEASEIAIYNLAGQKVAEVKNASEIAAPAAGAYIVKAVVAGNAVSAKVII